MSTPHQVLRTKKLSDKGSIGGSAKHLFREIETPNATSELTPNNVILLGPSNSDGILKAIGEILETPGLKYATTGKSGFGNIKKDVKPVLAIEYLFGYSHEAVIDHKQYFKDCLKWAQKKHGKENVVSAVIHYDERTPHMTVYVVPIHEKGGKPRQYNVSDGRNPDGTTRRKTITKMVGTERWLSAKTYVGSKKLLSDMQTEFHEQVSSNYGLARGIKGSRAVHQTVKAWYGKIPELPPKIATATREQLLDFGRAAFIAATRQKEALLAEQAKIEALRKESDRALDALRAQVQTATGAHREQLQAAERTIAVQSERIRSLGADLRSQAREFRRWIGDLLGRVWAALSEPDGAAGARRLLEAGATQLLAAGGDDAVRELLPEPPELRVELRELADGGWRASVVDRDDRETWSELHESQDDARTAAEAWIQDQQTAAPGM